MKRVALVFYKNQHKKVSTFKRNYLKVSWKINAEQPELNQYGALVEGDLNIEKRQKKKNAIKSREWNARLKNKCMKQKDDIMKWFTREDILKVL